MKQLITLLLTYLSATALLAQGLQETRAEVINHSAGETTLRLQLSTLRQQEVQTPQGKAFTVGFHQGSPLLQAGAPDLEKFSVNLQIPATGNMAVEMLRSSYYEIENIYIAPSKGNLLRKVDPASVPYTYGSVYGRDQFFPGAVAELKSTFVLRAQRGQTLWFQPLQYNPVTHTLRVYTDITVRVFPTEGPGNNELQADQPSSRTFEQLYAKTFLNYEKPAQDRGNFSQPEEMLIITSDDFMPLLDKYVEWKRQSGINTEVVSVSTIGSSTAAAVSTFVENYYKNHPITYLLIVGDENVVNPVMRPSGGADYSCDACFGYMSGNDHVGEVLVGRFNAATAEDLKIMLNRNLEYETNPLIDSTANWCGIGMASASNEGQGIGDDNQADYEQANEWKAKHLANGYEKFWEFYDGNHTGISPTPGSITADEPGSPTNDMLVRVMNEGGVSLYNYTGHGWEQGLVSGNFNTDAVAQLRNHHRYPFLIAVACCAGNFTNNSGGECLCEAFQRAGNPSTGEAWGGIGGFFSSDYQSWAPPMEGQDGMNQFLIDADGIALRPTLGSMGLFGNIGMIQTYQNDGEVMADFWNPFFDPTTLPRTRLPQPIQATHTSALFIGATGLDVQSPVEGALVSLYWKGRTLAVATVQGGQAKLSFPPLDNVGELVVTLTQFNHVPYQYKITVTPASGPFVIDKSYVLRDDTGNKNGLVDYNELISLDLMLSNVGVENAEKVKAVLSSSNPYVQLLDDTETLSLLEPGAELNFENAFSFQVNDSIPDKTPLNFNLEITFNDSLIYKSAIQLQAQAPKLEVTTLRIDDKASGNGNGRFDSGETVTLYVKTVNKGHSLSPDALATLTENSPWLTVNGPVSIAPLPVDALGQEIGFEVKVASNAPQVQSADFNFQIQAGHYGAAKTFGPYRINAIIESFETQNFLAYNWQLGGNKPWITTVVSPYDGVVCSRSGTITHNQESTMNLSLDVSDNGVISFARRINCEVNYDFLYFLIDSVEIAKWSGVLPWEEVSFPVTPGKHTFTWTYKKDQFGSSGQDRAWVDGISLPPYKISVDASNVSDRFTDLKLAPNPAINRVQLMFESIPGNPEAIRLLDNRGGLLRTYTAISGIAGNSWSQWIDLQDIPSGIYMLELRLADGRAQVVKLVKQ